MHCESPLQRFFLLFAATNIYNYTEDVRRVNSGFHIIRS